MNTLKTGLSITALSIAFFFADLVLGAVVVNWFQPLLASQIESQEHSKNIFNFVIVGGFLLGLIITIAGIREKSTSVK